MTVIAWDGHTLSADRMTTFGGTPLPWTKVHRLTAENGRRVLIGFSGNVAYSLAFMAWMLGDASEPPSYDVDASIMCVDDHMDVWFRCAKVPLWDRLPGGRMAIGCGADLALGAMEYGATSAKAVEIASRLNTECGFGVDSVSFDG